MVMVPNSITNKKINGIYCYICRDPWDLVANFCLKLIAASICNFTNTFMFWCMIFISLNNLYLYVFFYKTVYTKLLISLRYIVNNKMA